MDEEYDNGLAGSGWEGMPDNEGGGISGDSSPSDSGNISRSRLARNAALQSRIRSMHALANDSIAQGMGANAQQRWSGTPAIGLGMFKRRDPIFAYSGENIAKDGTRTPSIRRRIDASTRMSTPPAGLIGGQALTNASQGIYGADGRPTAFTPKQTWQDMFKPKSAVLPGLQARNLGSQTADNYDQTRNLA